MEDDVLQRQLVKCLNLRLTHRETEELRKFLDNDGDGTIDGQTASQPASRSHHSQLASCRQARQAGRQAVLVSQE